MLHRVVEPAVAVALDQYRSVTLADLARAARLSPGAPYQHFKGKEQIFDELAKSFGGALASRLEAALASAPARGNRLTGLYVALLEALAAERDLFTLFREAEFAVGRKPYEALLPVIEILERAVAGSPARGHDEARALAWCLFSLAYFPAIVRSVWRDAGQPPAADVARELARLARHGIEKGPARRAQPSKASFYPAEETTPHPASLPARDRILSSAEQLFSEKGFSAATVSAIARHARVSDTAVFLHFRTKEELLGEVVGRIRADLGRAVRTETAGLARRADFEEAGLLAFFGFLRERPGVYRIVREAEFVAPAVGQDYYRSLMAPYAAGLSAAAVAREVGTLDAAVTAQALMGLGHWLGLLAIVDGALDRETAVSVARRFVRRGLAAFVADGREDR
ncbi:MAG: TetR family transcriptional regulator [Candidatus Wallbacteria bacterium]|nr:TetR family transcriptional regulator [Candidatus Wallbacteria bacterium]